MENLPARTTEYLGSKYSINLPHVRAHRSVDANAVTPAARVLDLMNSRRLSMVLSIGVLWHYYAKLFTPSYNINFLA